MDFSSLESFLGASRGMFDRYDRLEGQEMKNEGGWFIKRQRKGSNQLRKEPKETKHFFREFY